MEPEIAGAFVGAGLTGAAGLITWALTEWSASRRAVSGARVALAREIIRHRGDQARVAEALNELPVVFGDDEEVLRLYRQFLDGVRKDDALLDLVIRLSKVVRLNRRVTTSDLRRFLSVGA